MRHQKVFTFGSLACAVFLLLSCGGGSSANAIAFFPETCDEQQNFSIDSGASAPNGTYTLYVTGDHTKPWSAYCHGMNLATPSEYLTVDEDDNFSGVGNGTDLMVTRFRRYRIDPVSLELDLLNDTFATTEGGPLVVPDGRTHIPAGWAQFTGSSDGDGPVVSSQLNVQGTEFVFAESVRVPGYFCTSAASGLTTGSDATVANDLTSVMLTAINTLGPVLTKTVADCAHLSPDDQPMTTDYVTATIPLQYED